MANAGRAQAARRMGNMGPRPILASPFIGWLPRSLWGNAKDFFVYADDYLAIAAGGTVTQNIAIQSDADFLIVAAVRWVTDTAAPPVTQANANFLAQITDQGSSRALSNRAVAMDNLFGTAQLPAYWPIPKLLRKNTTLATQLQSLETAAARNVRIAYLGFKVFDFQEER